MSIFSPSDKLLETLALWGIHTFGDFLALPAAEVGERLGPEANALRERASGDGRRPLSLLREPQSFDARHDFEHPVETLEPLTFVLHRLLETVCSRLRASYQVAGALKLTLKFDNGSSKTRTYRIPDPSADTDLLARIAGAGLETETAPAPVAGLHLEAEPARAGRHQFGLFESDLRDPHRFAETLARLEAMLGGQPRRRTRARKHPPPRHLQRSPPTRPRSRGAPAPSNRPTSKIPVIIHRPPPAPLPPAATRRSRPRPRAQSSPPRPAALLAGPRPRAASRTARGPWKATSGDWWRGESRWARQEWDVQLADNGGTLYRLVRSGGRWFLDGEYG